MLQNSVRLLTSRAIFSRPSSFKQVERFIFIQSLATFQSHLNRFNAVNYVNTNQILIKQLFSTSNSALAKKKGENGSIKAKRKRIVSASSSSDEDGDKPDGVIKKSRSE